MDEVGEKRARAEGNSELRLPVLQYALTLALIVIAGVGCDGGASEPAVSSATVDASRGGRGGAGGTVAHDARDDEAGTDRRDADVEQRDAGRTDAGGGSDGPAAGADAGAAAGSAGMAGAASGSGGDNAGGSGGTTSGGSGGTRPPDPGNAAAPWDDAVYGEIPEGAVYVFAEPYVTLAGAPLRVTAVQNAANPGTRDMTFAPGKQPLWHPRDGLHDRSYAEFNGAGDVGIASGFRFSQQEGTNELCIQVVGRFRSVVELTQATGVFASSTRHRDWHFRTFQVWSSQNFDFYRTNGFPVGFPHQVEYLTPEASNDTGWQLHEGYAKADGMIAFRNGVMFGTGGDQGLSTDAANPIDEIRIGGDDIGDYAPIDVHEVVITEGRDLAQLAAYRQQRIAPLYGLELR